MKDSLLGKVARERHTDLVREANRRRLARRLGRASKSSTASTPGARTDGQVEKDIEVRWGLAEDETRIGEILDLNGIPRRAASGEQFIVAEEGGKILAAMGYGMSPKRLHLGAVIADPWAGERDLAVALYAGARGLTAEIGVREVLSSPGGSMKKYLREAGYRRRGWRVRAASPSQRGD